MSFIAVSAALALAFANGSNDNVKGVARLWWFVRPGASSR